MPHRNGQNLSSQIRRPRTVPDLLSYGSLISMPDEDVPVPPRVVPPKLLLKVTVQGSLGPLQVLMTPESSVKDLVATTVRQYVKEGRRPVVPTTDPSDFDLHYSQFSFESLQREEKLIELGSRNFFLCPRKCRGTHLEDASTTPFASCSTEFTSVTKTALIGPTSN